jgi:hypothetical protein
LGGGTDPPTALSAPEEENFFGKHSGVEPEPERWKHVVIEAPNPDFTIMGWQQAASGRAAVWATENTREAVFDAMKRKEVYATTGSRIVVRFFGGWDFTEDDTHSRLPAGVGYAKGVPMGGDLRRAPEGKAPSFLVAAMKDPYSGNLDRIQIVKGWMDRKGEVHERVYDVAWSDGREPGADGALPPVGNTVDVARATWSNSIGEPELIAAWSDPAFDPAARVLLRAGDRDPDHALDGIRGPSLRDRDVGRRAHDDPGARVHLADLVYAEHGPLGPSGEADVAAGRVSPIRLVARRFAPARRRLF